MASIDFNSFLGFDRAVGISNTQEMSDNQLTIVNEIKGFGVDEIFFSVDEKNSYPAVLLKKVKSFEPAVLQEIATIHKKLWNYQRILFFYVYSDVEIRIYNCSEKPLLLMDNTDLEKAIKTLELDKAEVKDKESIDRLSRIFSSSSIDTGIIWTLPEAINIRKKINLERQVDKYLVDSLVATKTKLNEEGLKDVMIIHKIILRSLFLLYLEDRKATDANFYNSIKEGAKTYFDILQDVDSTYKLFAELENHFNGNVFSVIKGERDHIRPAHLDLIRKCFISGYDNDNQMLLFDWRIFDFKIIRIELLSGIYERFLEDNLSEKKKSGAYYTPPSMVELILNEKLPSSQPYSNHHIKILDPACGSGIFLVESYKRLIKRYENKIKNKLTDFEILKQLLTDNIFGIEINYQAIVVAAFSLYLALLDNLDPKTLWQSKKLPYLINDPNNVPLDKQGYNLFCRDTIQADDDIDNIRVDLVVGNPPFGTENQSNDIKIPHTIREYCQKENFAKDMVLPFMHKAVTFAPDGEIALIFNTKILTNAGTTYQKFRKWLFNECYVEKIYNFSILRKAPKKFGGQLFGGATGPVCIVFYRKKEPKNISDRIIYYAPKTFIKSNVIDGLVIDSIDINYLPREECKNPKTKIWKIAMWGNENDFRLIKRLTSNDFSTIGSYIKKNSIKSGVGFQLLTKATDKRYISEKLSELPYLDANRITRYILQDQTFQNITKSIRTQKATNFYASLYNMTVTSEIKTISHFRRLGDLEVYKAPHAIVKKGLEQNRVCALYLEKDCSFRDGVYGFNGTDEVSLKFLVAYLNSRLSTYFLFLTISSYGIERDQIMKKEYLSIPIPKDYVKLKEQLSLIIDKCLKKKETSGIALLNFNNEEAEINKAIKTLLNLDEREIALINDCIDINVDFFHKQEKSVALHAVHDCDFKNYGYTISSELNDFLNSEGVFANVTTYPINVHTPLAILKISFGEVKCEMKSSTLPVNDELSRIDKVLWKEKGSNIYFRKKVNYYDGNDIYIIRPNQRRFWTRTMAMETASELILEILNDN